ncbi:MAG TPA: hypothetical protein VKR32_16985 [Puia sp.]|nr:hypothetical protein [Puia sp.]
MKKLIPVLLLLSSNLAFAQQASSSEPKPGYLEVPSIPPFNLLKLDSTTHLTRDDLKKNRLTMIIFFSPTCDHCKHQTRDIMESIDRFKDIQIVMASYQPMSDIKEFYDDFHLSEHPNIKVGKDEKFFLPPFYRIRNLPFIALYSKKGDLITTFEGNQKVDTILNAFARKSN